MEHRTVSIPTPLADGRVDEADSSQSEQATTGRAVRGTSRGAPPPRRLEPFDEGNPAELAYV